MAKFVFGYVVWYFEYFRTSTFGHRRMKVQYPHDRRKTLRSPNAILRHLWFFYWHMESGMHFHSRQMFDVSDASIFKDRKRVRQCTSQDLCWGKEAFTNHIQAIQLACSSSQCLRNSKRVFRYSSQNTLPSACTSCLLATNMWALRDFSPALVQCGVHNTRTYRQFVLTD